MDHHTAFRIHLAAALLIGLTAGWLSLQYSGSLQDLAWPIQAARKLLEGGDPYTTPIKDGYPVYPLTTILIVMPLVWIPGNTLAALFVGCSTALLVWGVLRAGHPSMLLVLLSLPYWAAIHYVQWSPLFAAIWFIPALLPLTLAKPHIGIPVALAQWRWTCGTLAAAVLLMTTTFVIIPTWIVPFLEKLGGYEGYIPLTVLPFGPFIVLVSIRWRDPQARLLLLMACMPQRAYYDFLLPLVAAAGPVSLGVAVLGSWFVNNTAWHWIVPGIYGPLVIGHLVACWRGQ